MFIIINIVMGVGPDVYYILFITMFIIINIVMRVGPETNLDMLYGPTA